MGLSHYKQLHAQAWAIDRLALSTAVAMIGVVKPGADPTKLPELASQISLDHLIHMGRGFAVLHRSFLQNVYDLVVRGKATPRRKIKNPTYEKEYITAEYGATEDDMKFFIAGLANKAKSKPIKDEK